MSLSQRLWASFFALILPIGAVAVWFMVLSQSVVNQASNVRFDDVPGVIAYLEIRNKITGMQSNLHDYLSGESDEVGDFEANLRDYNLLFEKLERLETRPAELSVLANLKSLVREYEVTTKAEVFDVYSPALELSAVIRADRIENTLGAELRRSVVEAAETRYVEAIRHMPRAQQHDFRAMRKYVELAHLASVLATTPSEYVGGEVEEREIFDTSLREFNHSLETLRSDATPGTQLADILDETHAVVGMLGLQSQTIFAEYDPTKKSAALKSADSLEYLVIEQLDRILDQSVDEEGQEAEQQLAELVESLSTFRTTTLTILVVTNILGAVIFALSIRNVLASFSSLLEFSKRIVAGDMSTPITTARGPREAQTLNSALQTMVDRLVSKQSEAEAANRSKTKFLANVSHEIRTPLNVINGYAQILLKRDQIQDEDRESIKAIAENGSHLATLVDDVLDVSQIESGKAEANISAFEVRDITDFLMSISRSVASQKSLEFQVDVGSEVPKTIMQDKGKIQQILVNLVSNALKFTENGQVTVRVSATRGELQVEVDDSGVGIPREMQPRVFDRFESGEDTENVGAGLGLAISKRLSGLIGGHLELIEKTTPGALFRFTVSYVAEVPLSGSVEVLKQRSSDLNRSGKRLDVLIVDDNMQNRNLLKALLELHFDFDYRLAADGREAVNACEERMPDLIFMDVRMPKMDGLEATRRVRRMKGAENVAIIILSASVLDKERQDAMAAGATRFLRKPIDEHELIGVCDSYL